MFFEVATPSYTYYAISMQSRKMKVHIYTISATYMCIVQMVLIGEAKRNILRWSNHFNDPDLIDRDE